MEDFILTIEGANLPGHLLRHTLQMGDERISFLNGPISVDGKPETIVSGTRGVWSFTRRIVPGETKMSMEQWIACLNPSAIDTDINYVCEMFDAISNKVLEQNKHTNGGDH